MLLLGRLIFSRSSPTRLWQCHSSLIRASISRKPALPLQLSCKYLVRSTSTTITPDQPKTDRVWTIPNILTFIRIGTSPLVGYLIVNDHYPAALTLFIASGLTDLIDGWIARRYPSQASALGSFLDPLADKILVGIVVISLAYVNLIPLWLLALILSRDVAIMFAAGYLRVKSVPPPRTLKKILDMKQATVQLYPTFVSKVSCRVLLMAKQSSLSGQYRSSNWSVDFMFGCTYF